MDESAKQRLLQIARESVAAAVGAGPPPQTREEEPELMGCQGAFVTLRTHGELRGCLGRFTSDVPLCELVAEMAAAAATEDPRFVHDRLRPGDMDDLRIDISVLSPLERTSDPLSIELGVHGIYIKRGLASGCFLPQVATETGWSKEEFLGCCCSHKAGLPEEAWRDPDTEVYVFTAEVVEEP